MELIEKQLPILKFLRWEKPLCEHPEFVKATAEYKKKTMRQPKKNVEFFSPIFQSFLKRKTEEDIQNEKMANVFLSEIWPDFAPKVRQNIESISMTFVDALDASYDSFLNEDVFKDLENQRLSGTLILPSKEVICYDFEMTEPRIIDGELRYLIHGSAFKLLDGIWTEYAIIAEHEVEGDRPSMGWFDFVNKDFFIKPEKSGKEAIPVVMNSEVMGLFDFIIVYHLFKKYVPVETKESRQLKQDRENYTSIKTNQNITYIDCSWYTTIIRTEGFSVKGHFRLQPCGTGRAKRKLIYIKGFQKQGYVRRAKVLTQKNK